MLPLWHPCYPCGALNTRIIPLIYSPPFSLYVLSHSAWEASQPLADLPTTPARQTPGTIAAGTVLHRNSLCLCSSSQIKMVSIMRHVQMTVIMRKATLLRLSISPRNIQCQTLASGWARGRSGAQVRIVHLSTAITPSFLLRRPLFNSFIII